MLGHNQYAWYMGGITGMVQMILGSSAATYYFTWIVGDISKYRDTPDSLRRHAALPRCHASAHQKTGHCRYNPASVAIIGIVGYAINHLREQICRF